MPDHSSGLSLSLSSSLPCSCDHRLNRTMEETRKKTKLADGSCNLSCELVHSTPTSCIYKRKPADGNNLSCELVLSTPSCIYNGARLPQSSLPRPPMEVAESSYDSTTLSLELSLSRPPSTKYEGAVMSAGEELSATSDVSTPISCMDHQMSTELESLPQDPNLPYTAAAAAAAAAADGAEGSNPPPPSSNAAGELQVARRGTWEETAQRLKGTDPVRVLNKRLFSTDVSRDYTRFLFTMDEEDKGKSRPQDEEKKKIRERGPQKLLDMLTEAEKAASRDDGGLPVMLLDRWGSPHPGNKLRFWEGNHSYVILGRWMEFVHHCELEVGDAVEVYIFRVPREAAAPYLGGSSSSSAAAAPPSSEARAVPLATISGPQLEESLAVVVCSQVPLVEEERRRRESPEAKETRRQPKETAGNIKRKRKSTNRGSRG